MRLAKIISAAFFFLITALSTHAAVPQVINYQGFLTGIGGTALDTTADITFRIFDVATGGSPIWTETQSVNSIDGLFNVLLGINTPINETIIDGADRFLEIQLGASPFSPRTQLTASPYAIRIATVDGASGGTISSDLNITGNVGIGTATPQAPLEVYYDNSISTAPAIAINNPNTDFQQGVLDFQFSGASQARIRKINNGGFFIGTTGSSSLILETNSTNRLTIAENGNVGIGTTTPAAKLEIAGGNFNLSGGNFDLAGGNFNLENSTDSAGNIFKGGVPFIHNFGTDNTFIGMNAGNLTMTGDNNTASGESAMAFNTTGRTNTASGVNALGNNTSGSGNTASGAAALFSNTTGDYNTASGILALWQNTTGDSNTASGNNALQNNTTGSNNTAIGAISLQSNTSGSYNTAIGFGAGGSDSNLTNTTAIGYQAIVNASNKVRLGNAAVTVIEGEVAYTFTSDKNKKENFQPLNGNEVLKKIRDFELSSWNYKGHDPEKFRHYGPMAQDFYAAFGDDGVGKIGTETTLNSGDVTGILMVAVQELEKERERLKGKVGIIEAENKDLQIEMKELRELVQKLLAKNEAPDQTYTVSQK